MKLLVRTDERVTRSESLSLERFWHALAKAALGESSEAQKNDIVEGLAGIGSLCQRLLSETRITSEESDWRVRQETEPLNRKTRLVLTSSAGTMWIYLDLQAQPWAGVWFGQNAPAVGFNLEEAGSGCQFCVTQDLAQHLLALELNVTELGWTDSPAQGSADDWSSPGGEPNQSSQSWLFAQAESSLPAATVPIGADDTRESSASTPPPRPPTSGPKKDSPPPVPLPAQSQAALTCSRCGKPIKPGAKFCRHCGQPAQESSRQ
jgi:hypothetical protein